MPRTFPGLGPDTLVPVPKPSALAGLKLGAEEGFVLSRVDGRLTVGQICLLVPFDAEVTATILGQLARVGAVDIPGAVLAPAVAPPPAVIVPPAPTVTAPAAAPQMKEAPPKASPEMAAGVDLTADQARRIDEFFSSLQTRDAFELLEITRHADKKEIKRAYFKLSKELHPDRFFGKSIGPYKERLSKIFQSIKAAYELLSDDARRAAYLDSVK
ncbi:MAG TPA: J domain-containing protein [Polyangia bacterium]|nr:J domain-containing protein [Polyangia bacterium]